MKTSSMLMTGRAGLVISLLAFNASAYIAYDTPNTTAGNTPNEASAWNLGLEFTVGSVPVVVEQLGAFDNTGFNETITVTMWDKTTQTQVGSAAVFSAMNPGISLGLGGYQFLDVPDFILAANTHYVVVASGFTPNLQLFYKDGSGPSAIQTDASGYLSFVSVGENWYSTYTGSPAFPTLPGGATPQEHPRYGAGTFQFKAVPEPDTATLGAAAVGLFGMLYVARCVRSRRRQQAA